MWVWLQVIEGFETLKLISSVGSADGTPKRRVQVCDAGMFDPVREMEAVLPSLCHELQPDIFDFVLLTGIT